MKYVDDLSKVKPEEIEHIDGREIICITIIPDRHADSLNKVVVCFRDGHHSYRLDGRFCETSKQKFIYKPKKAVYVKSIEQILSEFLYKFDDAGALHIKYQGESHVIQPCGFCYLGKPVGDKHMHWPKFLLEEREIEEE